MNVPLYPRCPQPGCQTSQGERSRCQWPPAGERNRGAGSRGLQPPAPPGWQMGPGASSAYPRRGRPGSGPQQLTVQPRTSRGGGAQQEQRQQRTERRAPRGRRCPHAAGIAGAERSAAGRGGASGEGPALPARRKQRAVNHGRASRDPGGSSATAARPQPRQRKAARRGTAHRGRDCGCGRATDRPGSARRRRGSRSQKLSVAGAGSPGGQAVWGRLP